MSRVALVKFECEGHGLIDLGDMFQLMNYDEHLRIDNRKDG